MICDCVTHAVQKAVVSAAAVPCVLLYPVYSTAVEPVERALLEPMILSLQQYCQL